MESLDIIMQKLVAIESRLSNIEKLKTDIRKTNEITTTSTEPPKSKKGRRKRVAGPQGSSSTADRRQTQPKSTNRDFGPAVKGLYKYVQLVRSRAQFESFLLPHREGQGNSLWECVTHRYRLPGGLDEEKLWVLTEEFLEKANDLVLETLLTSQEKLVEKISVLNPLDKSRAKVIAEIYAKRQFNDMTKEGLDDTLAEAVEILGSKYVAEPAMGKPSPLQNTPGDQQPMDTAENDVVQANQGQRIAPVVLKQLPDNKTMASARKKSEHQGHPQKDNTTSKNVSPKDDATGAVDLTTGSVWPSLAESVTVNNGNASSQPKASTNAKQSNKQQQKSKHKPKWKGGF